MTPRIWCPISTAPKDGSEVVCLSPRTFLGPVMLRWAETAKWGVGWYDWDLDKPHDPEYWFPLPKAPGA